MGIPRAEHPNPQWERKDWCNLNGRWEYYYNPSTKNEKGISRNGRFIPMTDAIRKILFALRENQRRLGITSDWVFC